MKKSPLSDAVYLAHIREAIKAIKNYTKPGEASFYKDPMMQDAICRQLGIMGEAANKISVSTRKALNDMPWDNLIKNRNFLIHVYHAVSLPIVWKTAIKFVPEVGIALLKHKSAIALLERRAKSTGLER